MATVILKAVLLASQSLLSLILTIQIGPEVSGGPRIRFYFTNPISKGFAPSVLPVYTRRLL